MKHYFEIFFLALGVHLVHSQQLENVPVKLSSLASKLHYDKDIQENVNRLARDGQQVATTFKNWLNTDGSRILTEKNRLAKTSNSADVKVDILQSTLKRAKDSLINEQKDIEAVEIDVHISIEECKGRKSEQIIKQSDTNLKLEAIPKEIDILDQQIKSYDEHAGSLEDSARNLDSHAEDLRRVAREKKGSGVFGAVIGTIAGFALVPFTDELQRAATGLDDVGEYLRTKLNDIDNLLQAIQNMDTAMRDAELASNSFEIIQNAFHHGSVSLDAKSKAYLYKLKEKWTQVESILLQYGAKATLA